MTEEPSAILRILGDNDQVEELDIVSFEEEIAASFLRAGFKDTWMAEDISLTVEEKLRIGGGELMRREDIDALVQSLLNAAGFQDVAREYASMRGSDCFTEERRNLKHWTDASVKALLFRALPLDAEQNEALAAKCCDILRNCGLELATDKFVIGLALHLHLNDVRDLDFNAQENVLALYGTPKTVPAKPPVDNDYCRIMPYSSVFPKVRASVDFGKLLKETAAGWLSPIGVSLALEKILPGLLGMLNGARRELLSKYPRLAETPVTVIVTGIAKNEAEKNVLPALKERLSLKLDFECLYIAR
ncbi:MAG: hypothetical protein IKS20_15020 [Victivallales bacterium]|nr:hypothetical protein [Victivallales bacterium]